MNLASFSTGLALKKTLLPIALIAASAALADDTQRVVSATIMAPALSVACNMNDHGHIGGYRYDLGDCVTASTVMSTSTSAVLLKEVESARCDALVYAAGDAPSALLKEVAYNLQNHILETTGQSVTFDEAVNGILNSL